MNRTVKWRGLNCLPMYLLQKKIVTKLIVNCKAKDTDQPLEGGRRHGRRHRGISFWFFINDYEINKESELTRRGTKFFDWSRSPKCRKFSQVQIKNDNSLSPTLAVAPKTRFPTADGSKWHRVHGISAHAGNITEISAVIIASRDDILWALQLFAIKQNIAALLCK